MKATAPMSGGAGLGCLVLFLLPFATVGVFTMGQGIIHATRGDWRNAAFLGLFGLMFGLVGVGGIVAAMRARRNASEEEARRAKTPDTPWLWRPDWAAGKIEDSNRTTMYGAWAFAVLWNLISIPSAVLGVQAAIEQQKYGVLFVLLFPAVGIGLAIWAIRATVRFKRFGVSRLDLEAIPAPLGRSLRGTVVAAGALDARDGLLLTLTCLRRVITGSGKNRSTSERILWQEERRATGRQTRSAEGMVTAIPVAFDLPRDGEPCDGSNPRDMVLWRLAVSAEVPGVDYAAAFEVPVFRTAESDALPSGEPPAEALPSEPFVQSPESRVRVTRNRRGTEILYPAARNPGAAAGITAFLGIWLGVLVALVVLDAPLLFPLVFGAIALLLVWIAAVSWLGVTQVTVGVGAVTVASGQIAPTRERRLAAADISEVITKIGMQAGSTPYYDVVLVSKDGKKVTAGASMRDKREAEWLAQTMRDALRG